MIAAAAAAIDGGAAARAHDDVVGEGHFVVIVVGVATAAFAVLQESARRASPVKTLENDSYDSYFF